LKREKNLIATSRLGVLLDGEPDFAIGAGSEAQLDVITRNFGLGELFALVLRLGPLVFVLDDVSSVSWSSSWLVTMERSATAHGPV